MATLIPGIGSCTFDTGGERRLAERLEAKLEDDYLCWYNVPVGPSTRHPDFIILHPRRGLLVLEVKDWRRDTLITIDPTRAVIHADGNAKTVLNPLEQARHYAQALAAALEKDPQLVFSSGREAGHMDLMQVMDLHQEQLARSLGEGHRVIHGVAGSGKTLILGYRAEHLALAATKPILVLCYNQALAKRLARSMADKRLAAKVHTHHFHQWCRAQLVACNAGLPAGNEDKNAYFTDMVERVIRGVERGIIPAAQYNAILIDEGHYFKPEWFKLVVQMVDPNTNSLLVLYDDAQSIYGDAKRKKFSFKRVGIQAQGRTTILKVNYRNTDEILRFARDVAQGILKAQDADDDGVPLIRPQSAGRAGHAARLRRAGDLLQGCDLRAG